jgi:hypothetical protein
MDHIEVTVERYAKKPNGEERAVRVRVKIPLVVILGIASLAVGFFAPPAAALPLKIALGAAGGRFLPV